MSHEPEGADTDSDEGLDTGGPTGRGSATPAPTPPTGGAQGTAAGAAAPTTDTAPSQGTGTAREQLSDQEARQWSVVSHLSGLIWLVGIPGVVGPLVLWLMKGKEHPRVEENGREALNFQISLLIYGVVSVILAFVLIGFLFLAVLFVVGLVLPIVAAVKANNGEDYRYPFTIRFLK